MVNTLSLSDFDENKISFGNTKAFDKMKKIPINYDNEPFQIQTPNMWSPFGLTQSYQGYTKSPESFSLDVSFKNKDSKKSIERFYDFLVKLDAKVMQLVSEKASSLFKSEIDIPNAFTNSIRFPMKTNQNGQKEINPDYPPVFRLPCNKKAGKFLFPTFDGNKALSNLDTLQTKGVNVASILICNGIWCNEEKFGISWKIVQLRISPQEKTEDRKDIKYVFKDDERLENNEDDMQTPEYDDDDDLKKKKKI